jgi:integrase
VSAPMASLYKNGGRWYLSVPAGNGKRKGVSTGFRIEDKKKAEAFKRKYLAAMEIGGGKVVTVQGYGDRWLRRRRERAMKSAPHEDYLLRLHVYPTLGDLPLVDLTSRQVRDLLHSLATKQTRYKRPMAPRTVGHVYSTLKVMLIEAQIDGVVSGAPWTVLSSDLPKQRDRDPDWREGALFTQAECEKLIRDELVPEDRRVIYALLWLTGMRWGEAAAFRWSDYDPIIRPLGRIRVARSYSTARATVGTTKTGTVRLVPVHPTLAAVLARWRLAHPTVDENALVIPDAGGASRRADRGWQLFHRDLKALGIRLRRLHDLRRTFVTMARSNGAPADHVRWVVHGPSGTVLDGYTSTPWPALCAAVKCLRAKAPGAATVLKIRRRA